MFYRLLLFAEIVLHEKIFIDAYPTSPTTIRDNNNCSSITHLQCKDNRCLPISVRCNGVNDCGDFSDEHDCDQYLCRKPGYFRCKNQRCIASSFICDRENDCEDFSDEMDCEYFKAEHVSLNSTCGKGEWQCTDKLCIPEEWVCNQDIDCLDGSDEGIGCTTREPECHGFRCHNQRCVPNEWRCDGHNDCSDNSDELDCEHHFNREECTVDNGKFLCTDGKACIGLNSVCNIKNDCFDMSDEGMLCYHSSCNNHGCSHGCQETPTGPVCLCPAGFHKVDDKRCQDINECEQYGICDQKCTNTEGSYECYCEHKFVLQEDKRTCKANGGEATLIFSSKSEIRSLLLGSNLLFPVATDLKQVVGVGSDGHHIYWTEILTEHESIVRSLEDGSERNVLISSGLGLPEDLEVDWLTGNIYFTDAQYQHIGVCNSDASHCTILINMDIRKPRAIALNINDGTMFWTDWGKLAEIATAQMDGSNRHSFLNDDIHWPNGLAIDYPNSRIYWTDARKMTLENIRLDGTDRRIILKDVVKQPFAISVFENKLYWSDWGTHSIDSCDKFTGKNHHTLIKESKHYIYGLKVYHSALRQRIVNPCAIAFCSDICLLKSEGYSCTCSAGRTLGDDNHTCHSTEKKQLLVVAAKNSLLKIEHISLGKQLVTKIPSGVREAGAVCYNSRDHSIFVSDILTGKIIEVNLHSNESRHLSLTGLIRVVSMDYDQSANNLYVCDHGKASLEVISLNTMSQKILIHGTENERPESVAVVPQEWIMFVSFYNIEKDNSHIDKMLLDTTGRTHIVERGLLGPVTLAFDGNYHRLFFADIATGDIENINIEGDERHLFQSVHSSISDIATLQSDLFWTNDFSKKLYWINKASGDTIQKLPLDISVDVDKVHIVSATPSVQTSSACLYNNGNCSHICLPVHKTSVCACPTRMTLGFDNHHCVHRQECDTHEFLCPHSNTCILSTLKCNGKKDCPLGEDEENCTKETHCPIGYYQCNDGRCILEEKVCNHQFDCADKSDEDQCNLRTSENKNKCTAHQIMCDDGRCIHERFLCDGVNDCSDRSDESNCLTTTCGSAQFRCDSGECIPKTWECDHDYDCKDLSDEHDKCVISSCSSLMFTCDNGKCIEKSLRCDGSDDCGDRSDEMNCLHATTIDKCNDKQFNCSSSQGICLNLQAKCNGTVECPNGEDERNCAICGPDLYQCSDKKCIPSSWTCDGTKDCHDGSDENEIVCKRRTHELTGSFEKTNTSCDQGFRCKSGKCLDLSLICDGKSDCFDGSDENGLCSKSCEAGISPCQHECVKSPSGPLCRCRTGFRLMGDGYTCKDINECDKDISFCSQICHNTEGSFSCNCFEGFRIRGDKISCKSTGEPMSILYVVGNQIREIVQKTNSLRVLYSENMPKFTALDTSLRNRSIIFTVENSPTIQKVNIDTMRRAYISNIGYPRKISYDWSTGHIYYYNALPDQKSISFCSFQAMTCAKLIDIDLHRHVSELVVDSVNKVLFYSLTSWWVFNSPSSILYKASLDGSGKTEVIKSSRGFISGLTYDLKKRELFFAEQQEGEIIRTNYEGTQKTVLFSNLTHPFNLKFFENAVYFSTNDGGVSKCYLYGARKCEKIQISAHNYELFTISQESLQPYVEDVCKDHSCRFMCVASSSGHKCICEDGTFVGENEECSDKQRSSLNDGKRIQFHSVDQAQKKKPENSSKTLLSVLLISLFIILTGIGLIMYAKRRQNSPWTVSMRFSNPTYNKNIDDIERPMLIPGQHEYANPMPMHETEQPDSFTLDKKK